MEDEKKTVSQELTDEALDQVAGGCGGPKNPCPACGSTKYAVTKEGNKVCPDCGHKYFARPTHFGIF